MIHIITSVSRFVIIILFSIYTYLCFGAIRKDCLTERQSSLFAFQRLCNILIILDANIVIYLNNQNLMVLVMALCECAFVFALYFIYRIFYKTASISLVNNMSMLLSVGFIILTRLNINYALKQFVIACVALAITTFIPFIIRYFSFLDRLTYVYAIIGIAGLLSVRILGITEYGAKLSLDFGFFSLQPAEFIKIIFVFFVSCRLKKSTEFKDLVVTTAIAALHVLIMVSSKDLGSALIFLLTYLIMIYVKTKNPIYFFSGMGATAIASVMAYFMFSHVRNRVMAWKNPMLAIDTAGYQVASSLFAIGSGGWFGYGLTKGMPGTIPVVMQDFIFAAISEEMGGVFALCLIFVCISNFLMFMNVGLLIENDFYKLIALGLASLYAMQVFVSIGGVIKFIPATGITLPLVSYGGSSILATMIIFAIIQGLYVYSNKEIDYE